MNRNPILQVAEPTLGATQRWAAPRNRMIPADDDLSLLEPSVKPLEASRPRVGAVAHTPRVLRVEGCTELTAANCEDFKKQVCAALNGHTEVEVDLSQTTVMDCAGLGALVAIRNLTLGRQGEVRLVNPTSQVRQLLNLMRAGQIFEIVNSRR